MLSIGVAVDGRGDVATILAYGTMAFHGPRSHQRGDITLAVSGDPNAETASEVKGSYLNDATSVAHIGTIGLHHPLNHGGTCCSSYSKIRNGYLSDASSKAHMGASRRTSGGMGIGGGVPQPCGLAGRRKRGSCRTGGSKIHIDTFSLVSVLLSSTAPFVSTLFDIFTA